MTRGNWSDDDYPVEVDGPGRRTAGASRPDWDAEPHAEQGGPPPSPPSSARAEGASGRSDDPWADFPPSNTRRFAPPDAAADWSTLGDDGLAAPNRAVALAERRDAWRPESPQRMSRALRWSGGLTLRRYIGIAAVGAAIVTASGLLWPAWAVSTVYDKLAVQGGVQKVLSSSYGLDVGWVDCPADIVVTTGARFSCEAVVDGERVTVPARITDEDTAAYIVERV